MLNKWQLLSLLVVGILQSFVIPAPVSPSHPFSTLKLRHNNATLPLMILPESKIRNSETPWDSRVFGVLRCYTPQPHLPCLPKPHQIIHCSQNELHFPPPCLPLCWFLCPQCSSSLSPSGNFPVLGSCSQ